MRRARLLLAGLPVLFAIHCEADVERRAGAAADIRKIARGGPAAPCAPVTPTPPGPRVSIRGAVVLDESDEFPTLDREREARRLAIDWVASLLSKGDPCVDLRLRHVRSLLPTDRVVPGRGEPQPVHVVAELPRPLPPSIRLPYRRQGVHFWPRDPRAPAEAPIGPVGDITIEPEEEVPATTAVDVLWDDGILDLAVVTERQFADIAVEQAFMMGEALERWNVRLMSRQQDPGHWTRTYEGTAERSSGTILVRAEIRALGIPMAPTGSPPLVQQESEQAAREVEARMRAEDERWRREVAAHEEEVGRVVADALASHEVVILVGDFGALTLPARPDGAAPLVAGDQLVAVLGGDPEGVAASLAAAPRAPGRHLWVAGADGPGGGPFVPLQILGGLVAPHDAARPARLEELAWDFDDQVYAIHEIRSPEAP